MLKALLQRSTERLCWTLELQASSLFCWVKAALWTVPAVHPFPQPGEKPLDFTAAAADVRLHCLRCTAMEMTVAERIVLGSREGLLCVKVISASVCNGVSAAFESRFPSLP